MDRDYNRKLPARYIRTDMKNISDWIVVSNRPGVVVECPAMRTILFFRAPGWGGWRDCIEGLSQYAYEHDWMLMDVPQPSDMRAVSAMLCGVAPDGMLIDQPARAVPDPVRFFPGVPAILLDPPRLPSRFPVLVHDNRAIAEMAAEELMGSALAPRHLAYVPFPQKRRWSEERRVAFAEIVRERGGTCATFTGDALGRFLAKLPKPAGVFAANDTIAQQVMIAAAAEGLRVPKDVAVIGVDDEPCFCERTLPGISSVRTERRSVGYRFAALLDQMIDGRSPIPPVSVYAPVGITRRGSTRQLLTPDGAVETAIEYIRRNACSAKISLDDVAAVMKCPRCIATRRVRNATGHSIMDEIHNVRFLRMCELLRTTQTKISAIVNFCGYASEAFPKRYFLRRTGCTMRVWRKRNHLVPLA